MIIFNFIKSITKTEAESFAIKMMTTFLNVAHENFDDFLKCEIQNK